MCYNKYVERADLARVNQPRSGEVAFLRGSRYLRARNTRLTRIAARARARPPATALILGGHSTQTCTFARFVILETCVLFTTRHYELTGLHTNRIKRTGIERLFLLPLLIVL